MVRVCFGDWPRTPHRRPIEVVRLGSAYKTRGDSYRLWKIWVVLFRAHPHLYRHAWKSPSCERRRSSQKEERTKEKSWLILESYGPKRKRRRPSSQEKYFVDCLNLKALTTFTQAKSKFWRAGLSVAMRATSWSSSTLVEVRRWLVF
ncbi:hypothetical protein D3C71_1352060 [compost metagenome]